MKKTFSIIFIGFFIFSFFLGGCTSHREDEKIVAEVNKYKMTIEDLKYELKNIPRHETGLLKTSQGRRGYVDRLLEKEILLQEAQRQGIDKERDFMKSIENYWEQALLKSLLQRKSDQISGSIHVYDNEIEEYYKDSSETKPLSEVTPDIRRIIRQKKETEAMIAWIEELKERSFMKINEDILEEVFK